MSGIAKVELLSFVGLLVFGACERSAIVAPETSVVDEARFHATAANDGVRIQTPAEQAQMIRRYIAELEAARKQPGFAFGASEVEIVRGQGGASGEGPRRAYTIEQTIARLRQRLVTLERPSARAQFVGDRRPGVQGDSWSTSVGYGFSSVGFMGSSYGTGWYETGVWSGMPVEMTLVYTSTNIRDDVGFGNTVYGAATGLEYATDFEGVDCACWEARSIAGHANHSIRLMYQDTPERGYTWADASR